MKFGTLPPKLPIWHPVAVLSTWGGSGLLPGAPGTWGSLFTLPLAWVVASEFGHKSLIILAAITFIFGTWATSRYLQKS
ncbi:MAG: phosphatidylglycerophosphatase A, partial [Pseudomonadota bacterium]|nr:phosphatidylglycerophosphatase A [Pseudomonadota bacterium]